MWLICSSIGKKLIMSITGACLVLFVTFHMVMNLTALIPPSINADGELVYVYNVICEFLGANWYALVATVGLALLAVIHIVYAFVLYFNNKKARGNSPYAVTAKPKEVEWASQNMLALGIAVLIFLGLHLYHFWSKMQLVEVQHMMGAQVNEAALSQVTNGIYHIQNTFSHWYNVVLYLIAFGAFWFHLTHGFWSALQTMGINNQTWFNRWRCIGNIWVTIVMLGYAAVVITFYIQSLCA
jgi:succinate dehydrogenase / fumarate reductase cytochrome b subunit